MRNKLYKILVATLGLALVSTLSCSNEDENGGNVGGNGSNPNGSGVIYGTPVTYGDEIYETVVIGTQTWLKRNLNYNPGTGNSACYDCAKYGRLYNWATAMALDASCNSNSCSAQIQPKHRGICPPNFHIPSNADWEKLMRYVDGDTGTETEEIPYNSPTAGRYLKARSGWNSEGNGEDTYGFSALPGGSGGSDGSFSYTGDRGYWWSTSEHESYGEEVYSMYMSHSHTRAYLNNYGRNGLRSVRCVLDQLLQN